MLSTDTALFLGLTWFFFIAAWCAVTYIVRALTWLDDGDGTLFPGVFSTLTDSNADWKRYWMLDGVLIRIFTPWYRHHEYAEYDNETKYEGPLFLGLIVTGVIGGVFIFALAHIGLYVLLAGLATASLYGGRCVVRARKQMKE